MDQVKEINGVIKCKRNDNDNGKCVCCKGKHIFCTYISKIGSAENINVNKIVNNFLTEDNENKKIKIVISVE